MKNPSGNKLEKLVFGMFDQMVEGADKYVTKQGSTWLIFTESKKWVIEFTRDKTLWFNYNIFQGELEIIGKDCTEERDLIKNWFESRFLNKPKVKEAHHVDVMKFFDKKMENTIENGVKDTYHFQTEIPNQVEDAIQEGVKRTFDMEFRNQLSVEDTIQEGVKDTTGDARDWPTTVEDIIQNEVKEINKSGNMRVKYVEDIIQNGVKQTSHSEDEDLDDVEDTIQEGVKDTTYCFETSNRRVEDTIQNGVKETIGTLRRTKLGVDDIIQNGVKETKENRLIRTISVISTIKNGVKHVEDGDWLDQDERIDDIIENGVKETKEISNISLMSEIFKVKAKQTIRDGVKELKVWKSNRCEEHGYFELVDGIPTYTPMTQVKDVLENGVKEIQPLPARDGNRDWGLYYQRQGNLTKPHTEYVKEVIEDSYNHMGRVEGVIRNTDKDGI
jgi:hypothetical protein